jgi:nucleoside-diphosphate-sugar epimerase
MTQSDSPIAAITGANGYVGSLVADALSAAGFTIRRLVRQMEPGRGDHSFDLVNGCSSDALQGVDVLVHCAYDMSLTSRSSIWKTNVYGTRSLLDAAASAGVRRTIVVSSMSAYAGTRQIYGLAKLSTETDAFARGMCVIRPGLVYGPGWGGMARTLRNLTSLPVVPLVGRHAHQFTLHEDDLRNAIVVLAVADAVPSKPLGLANQERVPFEFLLRSIAQADGGHEPRFLPIPWQPLYWALRAAERTPIDLPVRADSLLGLVRPAPFVPHPEVLSELGISLRPFTL